MASPDASGIAFRGARWFDGEKFVAREAFVVDGFFVESAPAKIVETVDLTGKFVIPPFGDAHAHHFDNAFLFERINSMYLDEGIFYGISMTNSIAGKNAVRAEVDRTDTIDVAYADAGITATLGHPIMVYETLARGEYTFDKTLVERALDPKAKGDAYFIVDTADELDEIWPAVLASSPDLVKIYLMYSEEYEQLRDGTETYGDRGLNPALVPAIVARARDSAIRLAVHVETAADFRTAVAAGVNIIAHLPGYSPDRDKALSRYRLTEADAQLAAQNGVVVVPTPMSSGIQRYEESDPDFLVEVRALHKHNIGLLADAGVALAIGSDSYMTSPSREAKLLHELGLFSNRDLLQMWCVTTPQLAFPQRRIGRLAPGYEASFIALDANPLEDFAAVEQLAYRVKQGQAIN